MVIILLKPVKWHFRTRADTQSNPRYRPHQSKLIRNKFWLQSMLAYVQEDFPAYNSWEILHTQLEANSVQSLGVQKKIIPVNAHLMDLCLLTPQQTLWPVRSRKGSPSRWLNSMPQVSSEAAWRVVASLIVPLPVQMALTYVPYCLQPGWPLNCLRRSFRRCGTEPKWAAYVLGWLQYARIP